MEKRFLFTVLFCLSYAAAFSQTYYIDYAGGSDSSDGLSATTAWVHCPGDANAILNAKNASAGAGATFLFKGGVHYRGTIVMKFSGGGVPVTYKGDGWGVEKAIIDGADILPTQWQACQSAADAGGNPNWHNIFYTAFSGTISPFNQLFENGERAFIAQTPNMSDPFWDDRIDEYFTVLNGNITRTSLRDDIFLNQASSDYWNGAYIQMWIQPNVIGIKKVISFDPGSHTIFFDSLSSEAVYGDRDQFYCMVNHLSALDRPGEYVIDEANQRLYYWPYGNIADCVFSASTRSYGLGINGCSNVCIEGLKVQGNTSDGAAYAIWNNKTWDAPAQNIIIRNCEITQTRTRDGRKGSISIDNADGVLIESNFIHNCQRNSGINAGAKNVTIRNNIITKVGYKGIWSMGSENLRILNNTITECEGTHGNPVSVFTTTNSLTANNFLEATSEVFTFEGNTNTVVHNNIILGVVNNEEETGTNIIRQNGSEHSYCYGYTVITNNTLLFSKTNNAVGITQYFEDLSKVIVKNNISDGGPGGTTGMSMSRSNNIYTGLSWSQKERYGWYLMDEEYVMTNLDTLFISPAGSDFHLSGLSPARNNGLNPDVIIPLEIKNLFPDYSFSQDFEGKIRGIDGSYDIGALEYSDPNGIDDPNGIPEKYSLSQNYPNPFNPSTCIDYHVSNTGFVTLKIYDILGREVVTLINETISAGDHTVEWNGINSAGKHVGSGVYFYVLRIDKKFFSAKKMLLLE
ncbi:MAG: right-handed parallel beta-helix repeat-containing protein [Bacteroidetes bacterium]|nr:right-handed parallel beta-helix repeat-containing protein [Bacteroidota bacterium]